MSSSAPLIIQSYNYGSQHLLIQGCSTFGEAGTINARINSVKEVQDVVDVFVSLGQTGFDTSRRYGGGTSEEVGGRAWFHMERPLNRLTHTVLGTA